MNPRLIAAGVLASL
jgi:hypothetical protein